MSKDNIVNKKSDKTNKINKYLQQVDLIELYITKNICKLIKDPKELEFIKSNIFLLGFTNKNRKNSLKILLENSEYSVVSKFIELDETILNYKTTNEVNLFQLLLTIEHFYNQIIKILENERIDFIIKLVTNTDNNGISSVDMILSLININQERISEEINKKKETDNYTKLKQILKLIYDLDKEEETLVINKLCSTIQNTIILINILNYINPKNLEIYPDKNMLTCIDYLLLTDNNIVLDYVVSRTDYIYFVNTDNNNMFSFIENFKKEEIENNEKKEKFIKLVFSILSKSDIKNIKNIKNENIFFILLQDYEIDPEVIKKYINLLDIYEQNTDGISIYDILKNKYKNKFSLPGNKEVINVYKKIDFKKILEPTDIGIFNSDIIHNMIYTTIILRKYSNITIPYFIQDKEYFKTQEKLLLMSNNQKYITSFLKLYFYNFTTFLPFMIIWKNKNNYYFDQNLLKSIISNKKKDYIYIRLSISLLETKGVNLRHANIILIDNRNKIIERFEPYGEINYINSDDINKMIIERISKPLEYEFKFVQSYPGFQARSDEFNKYNKVYGDPSGFCLAWCLLYLEIRLIIDKYKINSSPIDLINWYIINKFKKEYKEIQDDNQNNLYMVFIRYYSKKLDSEKKELLKRLDINPKILYNVDLKKNNYKIIIKKLNDELIKYTKKE